MERDEVVYRVKKDGGEEGRKREGRERRLRRAKREGREVDGDGRLVTRCEKRQEKKEKVKDSK